MVMRKMATFAAALTVLLLIITGCETPSGSKPRSTAGADEYISVVQQAVNHYQKDRGVLPIKNKPAGTPLYIEYPIDFSRLVGPYLNEVPSNAFENGGDFQYVLIHAETRPMVKLVDLVTFQQVQDIQSKVDKYIEKHYQVPSGAKVQPHVYRIDFKAIHVKQQQTFSVFTNQPADLLIDSNGKVLVNYTPDIMYYWNKKKDKTKQTGIDLRTLLVNATPFVPIDSLPYFWVNGQLQMKEVSALSKQKIG